MAVALPDKNWEEYDATRLRLGVEELLSSPNGRFLLRNLLEAFGTSQTPFDPEPTISAYRAGRHSCAKDLEATLLTHDTFALARLMQENAEETEERKSTSD